MVMTFVFAFIVGGIICVIGQLLMDVGNLTPGHTLSTLVVLGAILDGMGLYEPLINFAGAGATVPITSFGNSLTHGCSSRGREAWTCWRINRHVRSNKFRNQCCYRVWLYWCINI